MDEITGLDLQDKSAHISSLNKTPASIVQEYAAKNHLVPQYEQLHGGISQNKVTFKYSLILGDYKTIGEGTSKKEAKHVAALNLLKKMIHDNPLLLETEFRQWDFDNHVVSPFDNNIKVNAVGQLNDICANNRLPMPEFVLVREEGQAHAKLFTISCHVAKIVEVATHKTKKQAKHLVSVQMLKRFSSLDKSLVSDNEPNNKSDSIKVLEQVELIKNEFSKKCAPMDQNVSNYHLLFKKTEWLKPEILSDFVKQYFRDGRLNLNNPHEVLKNIVEECGIYLIEKIINKEESLQKNYCYVFAIDNVYPPVFGSSLNKDVDLARDMAAAQLLENICLLSK